MASPPPPPPNQPPDSARRVPPGDRFAKLELPLGSKPTVQTGECVDWKNHSLIVDILCIHNHTLIIYDIICIMDWVACIILISLYCYIFIHYILYYMINVYNHSKKVCDISIKL